MIAATACLHGLVFATLNIRDLQIVPVPKPTGFKETTLGLQGDWTSTLANLSKSMVFYLTIAGFDRDCRRTNSATWSLSILFTPHSR
jgi:hypothetical protein